MKNKQRTTNNEQRTYRAFTLIELVVAVALLGIVFLFAGTIFKVSINAYRTAVANAEIMQKLRAITDQLNADFKGIQTDAPLLFWFEQNDSNRYDQIMFFADGDFQSTQLYNKTTGEPDNKSGDKLVIGNVARIHYGRAQPDPNLLARRQHILTADPCLIEWPHADMSDFGDTTDGYKKNERYEHDSLSLAQWKTVEGSNYNNVVTTCFGYRPSIDMDDPNTFHKLMCEGVGSFTIQWAYWDSSDEISWYPTDIHFATPFGVYFNVPGSISGWVDGLEGGNDYNIYPVALKFTFTLYDSKGVMKNGRTFTHIVYLGK